MNELLGKQRAIVSSIAGTTRDYIEERCLMNGRLIRLVDMAGIRETHDEIEAEGVYRANSIAAESDIVLVLVPSDVDQRTAEEIIAKANLLASQNQILVIQTKSDIPATHTTKVDIKISCANRVGIKELENLLAGLVDQRLGSITDKPFITSARQKAAVQAATDSLKKFWQSISAGYPQELVAFELQQAANALKEVTGSISTEDILDKVFSEFCIGK
jgi:tRNA modification GTPase